MRQALTCKPLDSKSEKVPVQGISEWSGYHAHPDIEKGDGDPVKQCIDAHLEPGINLIVRNCGRSTVDYRSDLPNTTRGGNAHRSFSLIPAPSSIRAALSKSITL